MDFKRILLEACVLVAFGALFGLTMNHQLVLDAFSGQLVSQQVDEEPLTNTGLPMPVLIDEVQQIVSAGAVLVDARSPELFAEGHIEGAISLPLVDIDNVLPVFLESTPKGQTIIAYCSGFGCPDSFDLGMLLLEEGFNDVRIFEGGFPEWRDAGLPIAGSDQ